MDQLVIALFILMILVIVAGLGLFTYFVTMFAFEVNTYLGWAVAVLLSLKWLLVTIGSASAALSSRDL